MASPEPRPYERALIRIEQVRKSGYRSLDLYKLGLTVLPPEIGQLTDIIELDLRDNRLTELPPQLERLRELTVLKAQQNRLSSLPAGIGLLHNLQKLFLLQNKLTTLPKEIGQLRSLRELYLWGNELEYLPSEIGQLHQLIVLNLGRNKLADLPRSLQNLRSLEELYLHGNPTLQIPVEVLGPSPAVAWQKKIEPARPSEVLKFLFNDRSSPLLEARIIIIGDGEVGKTSLAKQLVYGTPAQEKEPSTPGVVIEKWDIDLRETDVRVNIWDFGGQEPMHAAHPYFFTERTLYLVVASARPTGVEERIEYWLKMVERYGGGCRALVAVNKTDQNAMDIARRGICEKYRALPEKPNDAFFPTSCISGEGIADLKKAICSHLNAMTQIWDRIPAEYFEVKTRVTRLQQNGQDIISFAMWNDICTGAGVTNDEDRESLLDLLRNLGLAGCGKSLAGGRLS